MLGHALRVVPRSVDLPDGLVDSSLSPLIQEASELLLSFVGWLTTSAKTLDLPPRFGD